jgi:hypothetical protein
MKMLLSLVSPRIVNEIEDSHYSGRLSVSLGSCLHVLVLEWLAPETMCIKYIYSHSGTPISRVAGLLNQINAPSDLGHVLVARSSKGRERIRIVGCFCLTNEIFTPVIKFKFQLR